MTADTSTLAVSRKLLASTPSERKWAEQEAERLTGISDQPSGFTHPKTGKFVRHEEPYSPLGDSTQATAIISIADAHDQECGQVFTFEEDNSDDFDESCGEGGIHLFAQERYIQRKQEKALCRRRSFIIQAIQTCETDECKELAARECMFHLRRGSGGVRGILAAWADKTLSALGLSQAEIRTRIAEAAQCSVETARGLIAQGNAELRAAEREADHAVSRAEKVVKPDLREIEIGSAFDTTLAAHAISRLMPEHQRAFVLAIERRFSAGAIEEGDSMGASRKIKLLSRGMQIALDGLDRNDLVTRDFLGRLNPDLAKRFVAVWESNRADTLMGLSPSPVAVANYAELLEEAMKKLNESRVKPDSIKRAKRTVRTTKTANATSRKAA